jgi:hypothetical protein
MFRQQRAHGGKNMLTIRAARAGATAGPTFNRIVFEANLLILDIRAVTHPRFLGKESMQMALPEMRIASASGFGVETF